MTSHDCAVAPSGQLSERTAVEEPANRGRQQRRDGDDCRLELRNWINARLDAVRDDQLANSGIPDFFERARNEHGVGRGNDVLRQSSSFIQRADTFDDRPTGADHVVDDDASAPGNVPGDPADAHLGATEPALVADRDRQIQLRMAVRLSTGIRKKPSSAGVWTSTVTT
jgi:hypothetical protein